jgi:hypothetical protein
MHRFHSTASGEVRNILCGEVVSHEAEAKLFSVVITTLAYFKKWVVA